MLVQMGTKHCSCDLRGVAVVNFPVEDCVDLKLALADIAIFVDRVDVAGA